VRASHRYTALVFTYDVLLLLWQRTLKQTKGYNQNRRRNHNLLVCYHNIYNSNCSPPAVVQFGLN
jgi:hypothetical protein